MLHQVSVLMCLNGWLMSLHVDDFCGMIFMDNFYTWLSRPHC